MTWDDFIYAFLLILSIFGALISSGFNPVQRKYFMSISGLLIGFIVCGSSIWHSLLISIVSICIICSTIQGFHIIVFVLCFGYLVFFRTCHLMGYDKPPSYTNAIQLVLTLKLVGAAFEIKDSLERENKLKILLSLPTDAVELDDMDELKLEIKHCNVKPNGVDLFLYSYCFIGLLTGPYFKYRVYLDCVSARTDQFENRWKQFWSTLRWAGVIGVAYLVASHFYFIEYARSDEFYDCSFLYRFSFMTAMFLVFRLRMYFAWLVSHCVCMCAGMGAYPASSKPQPGCGPTDLHALDKANDRFESVSYETTRNLSIAGCEWAPSVREGMRSWNMSVQFWLVSFVYRRCPSKQFRTLATMLVSAFWHGVHPGYYLSFMTIPLALGAEASLDNLIGSTNNDEQPQLDDWRPSHLLCDWSRFVRWFYKMRVFDYCCMGFLLLGLDETLRYWWSIGLSVHIAMVALIGIGLYAGVGRDNRPSRGTSSSKKTPS